MGGDTGGATMLTQNQRAEYRELKDYGVEVRKENSVRFNAGGTAETVPHITAKTLAAKVLLVNGYRVDSETQCKNGEIDILGWGHPDRLTYAVEVETGLTQEVKESKIDRYVKQTPIDDIQFIECNNLPLDMVECYQHIADTLGLQP